MKRAINFYGCELNESFYLFIENPFKYSDIDKVHFIGFVMAPPPLFDNCKDYVNQCEMISLDDLTKNQVPEHLIKHHLQ